MMWLFLLFFHVLSLPNVSCEDETVLTWTPLQVTFRNPEVKFSFDETKFVQFYLCLCDQSSYQRYTKSCVAEKTEFTSKVTSLRRMQYIAQIPDSNKYMCEISKDRSFLTCTRPTSGDTVSLNMSQCLSIKLVNQATLCRLSSVELVTSTGRITLQNYDINELQIKNCQDNTYRTSRSSSSAPTVTSKTTKPFSLNTQPTTTFRSVEATSLHTLMASSSHVNTSDSPTKEENDKDNTTLIVGIVLGTVAGVVIVSITVLVVWRRNKLFSSKGKNSGASFILSSSDATDVNSNRTPVNHDADGRTNPQQKGKSNLDSRGHVSPYELGVHLGDYELVAPNENLYVYSKPVENIPGEGEAGQAGGKGVYAVIEESLSEDTSTQYSRLNQNVRQVTEPYDSLPSCNSEVSFQDMPQETDHYDVPPTRNCQHPIALFHQYACEERPACNYVNVVAEDVLEGHAYSNVKDEIPVCKGNAKQHSHV